jgi:hypothetical protein
MKFFATLRIELSRGKTKTDTTTKTKHNILVVYFDLKSALLGH